MTFTATVDVSIAGKLEKDLQEQGFTLSRPPHTILQGKKKGISCTLYESGKLVVQGSESAEFIEFYIEPELLGSFTHTHPMANIDLKPRIGMDEAGKGDFFGPLCVAAIYANEEGIHELHKIGVKDSKRINDAGILKLAKKIRAAFPYTAVRLFPQKYNELYGKFKNLNRLLAWAHTAALADLSQKTDCKVAILDQFADERIMQDALKQKKLNIELTQRVRGEEDLVVAAASILARAAFLEGMDMLSQEYGVVLPKGANGKVRDMAATLKAKLGEEALSKLVKTHFKTMGEL